MRELDALGVRLRQRARALGLWLGLRWSAVVRGVDVARLFMVEVVWHEGWKSWRKRWGSGR